MAQLPTVYICLGGNLGDTRATFQHARALLSEMVGTITGTSQLYLTAPLTIAGTDASLVPTYMNAAIRLTSSLTPQEILASCLLIEARLGRIRDPQNQFASRTLDLDIALIEQDILELPSLTIPHPRLHERDFMLQPIIDIDPHVIHPVLQASCSTLLARLDSTFVKDCLQEIW
jgi:2-amino-4-hydroxy-6-hydroxymethyldihydropteridine diphosphokinase